MIMKKSEIETLLEDDDSSVIAVDDDGDAYLLPSGLPNNLLALPACDDNGAVLNALQWQNMVARFNAAPALARTALDALARLEDAEARLAAAEAQVGALEARLANGMKWCDMMDGPVSRSQFVNGQATAAQQIRAALASAAGGAK